MNQLTLDELRTSALCHFAGLTTAQRILRVCTIALREGKRVVAVHLPVELYANIEQYGMQRLLNG